MKLLIEVMLFCCVIYRLTSLYSPAVKLITPAPDKNFGIRFSGSAQQQCTIASTPVNNSALAKRGAMESAFSRRRKLYREYCGGDHDMGPTVPRAINATVM